MNEADARDRIWREMARIGTCMLVTQDGDALRARPMTGRFDAEAEEILFVADRRGAKDDEIEQDAEICLTFQDGAAGLYLSVSGTAAVSADRQALGEVWNDSIDAWFEKGPEDEQAILIRVAPEFGEIWDTVDNRLLASVVMLRAEALGQRPRLSESRKVAI